MGGTREDCMEREMISDLGWALKDDYNFEKELGG